MRFSFCQKWFGGGTAGGQHLLHSLSFEVNTSPGHLAPLSSQRLLPAAQVTIIFLLPSIAVVFEPLYLLTICCGES